MAIDLSGKVGYSTIVLQGELGERHEEFAAGGTIRPGHLVMPQNTTGTETVVVHGTAAGSAPKWFAKEDALIGMSPTKDRLGATAQYTTAGPDLVPIHIAQPGDLIYARLPASATAIVKGDALTSNGDGCLKKTTAGTDFIIGRAEAAVDNSGGGGEVFIPVRIV